MKLSTRINSIALSIILLLYTANVFCHIKIIDSSSPEYDKDRSCLNKKFNLYPAVIYYCQTVADVKQAIEMAKKQNKKIRIRSGNHSYEAFSNGNNVAIIDVSAMKQIHLNIDKTVSIGAGATLLNIYQALWKNKLTIPGGSCGDVGISGLVLGGGIGFSSRKMGLTCDNVLEYEMVTAAGDILNIKPDNDYRDLFWALCGAGNGNFGVITSIKFKTHPVDKLTIFHLDLDWNKMNETTDAWFNLLKNAPRELMLFLRFAKNNNHKTLSSFGQFFGTPKELYKILKPLLKYATKINIREVNYMYAMHHWAGRAPTPEYFKASSIFLTVPLSHAALKTIDRFFSNKQINSAFLVIDSYGGAISDISPDSSAFAHRDKLASIQMMAIWENNKRKTEQEQWIYNLRKSLAAYGIEAYINYPDASLDNWQHLYYGNHYSKLQNLKAKYYPDNLFTYEQAIELPKS